MPKHKKPLAEKSRPSPTPAARTPNPALNLPIFSWQTYYPKARLVYCSDLNSANAFLGNWHPDIVGFDIEWKPNYVKGETENPVALVQLASSDTVVLIHLSMMRNYVPHQSVPHLQQSLGIPYRLKALLSNPNIIKLGVGIKGDAKKFYHDHLVDLSGCVDISTLAMQIDRKWADLPTRQAVGLSRLCAAYLELNLAKGKISRSNWERSLSHPQQQYAANDAMVSIAVYEKLSQLTDPLTTNPAVLFNVVRGIPSPTEILPFTTRPASSSIALDPALATSQTGQSSQVQVA